LSRIPRENERVRSATLHDPAIQTANASLTLIDRRRKALPGSMPYKPFGYLR